MYLAYSAVDTSFELVKIKLQMELPTKINKNSNSSQVVATENEKLQTAIKTAKKLEKPVYKKIDFTPIDSKKIVAKAMSVGKPAFIEVAKSLPVYKNTEKNMLINFANKVGKKKQITISELELSYQEIPEQGKFQIAKIQQVAWSKFEINFEKYIAKNDKETDRISTAASAPERSKEVNKVHSNSMNFSGSSQKSEFLLKDTEVATLSKEMKKEELVFFDYDQDENKPEKEIVLKEEISKKDSEPSEEKIVIKNNRSPAIDPLDIQKVVVNSLAVQPRVQAVETEIDEKKIIEQALLNIKKKSAIDKAPKTVKTDSSNSAQKSEFEKSGENQLIDTKSNVDYACLDAGSISNDETYTADYTITLTGIEYSDRNYETVRNFEVRFYDDHNESKKDYGNGQINLNFKMNTQMSVRRGTFVSRGYYPTTTDIIFEAGSLKANIPVFSLNSFETILNDHNLRGLGGHLLVELDEKTEDVELDKEIKYEAKLYLNKQFKVVSRSSYDYNFVLFIGVEVGNTIVNFRNNKDEYVTKLLHITGDEIYYEPNFYAEVDNDFFAVYEERLLSKCKSIKNINPKKIEPWSYNGKISKEALNKVKVRKMIYPLGSRKYFEFKHLDESIFVGRWSEENIVMPSEEYISHVVSKFNLDQSQSKCLVQLNFSKSIRDIAYTGLSGNNNMNMQLQVLDEDGQFFNSFSSQSQRAFLMGEDTGVINIKIDYTDGSTQFLQSYCSKNTYIVEQL